ncbi:MAG: YfhO family protein [Bacteroidota bacterium]|nr:YfhO family protein [Bacteroidota bacterium]
MNEKLKKLIPYITALAVFFIISLVYFPEALQGKKLNQHDKKTWRGGAEEIIQYEKETDEHSYWTNSMFSGMPAYLVSNYAPNNVSRIGYKIIDFGHKIRPLSYVFMLLVGFWISLLFFKVDPWLSLAGAIALAFSTYFFIIMEAGHITKLVAIAFMGPIIAGMHYAYKEKALPGTLVMMVFLAMQLLVNHLQITYYTLLIVGLYFIFVLVDTIKSKEYKQFTRSTLFLVTGALIAASTNFSQIITAYDYGQDSIRGQSELSFDAENKTSGLDKDYATAWSYGKLETFNLIIPNLMGGASQQALSENSAVYKKLKGFQRQNPNMQNPKQIIKKMPTYWGPQPFTSGPVYIGALIFFLFVMGSFLVKGRLKWWLITITALSILLAWGENFNGLTNFFLEYFPLYNKFRTVSMILVIAEFSIPVLGILALREIIQNKVSKTEIMHALKWSAGIVGGIILLLIINPGILSFENAKDAQMLPEQLISALEEDRASIFRKDAWRSLFFVAVGVVSLWLFVKEKIKSEYLVAILALAFIVDLWPVNKRFINSEDFVKARKEREPFQQTPADAYILEDDGYNRVLNLTVSTFNDASTSYFHSSIGGYHGAKLRRYQDVIDYHISDEINRFKQVLQANPNNQSIDSVLNSMAVLNMLNMKYIILNPETRPVENTHRRGNAWFVNDVKLVKNPDEEISALVNPNKINKVKGLFNRKNDWQRKLENISGDLQKLNAPQGKDAAEYASLSVEYRKLNEELQIVVSQIAQLRNFNPKKLAIVNKTFEAQIFEPETDSSATIVLTDYKPNALSYTSKTSSDQIAVFSDIYYAKGWNAYIDGEKAEHFRANYLLRAMKIPAGEHQIVFEFRPEIVKAGNTVSLIGSVVFSLLLLGGLVYYFMQQKQNADVQADA